MRSYNHGRFQQQASFLKRQYLQDGALPFTNILSEIVVAQTLAALRVCWLDRIYSPLVTLWVFLGQVLSADHRSVREGKQVGALRFREGDFWPGLATDINCIFAELNRAVGGCSCNFRIKKTVLNRGFQNCAPQKSKKGRT
jgi:hypothetical protein